MNIGERIGRVVSGISHLGVLPAIHYRVRRTQNRALPPSAPFRLYSRRVASPLLCRPQTSDIDVFSQIFVHREYRCLDEVTTADLVIDCGANVGYSTAYFLSAYPAAIAVAVEPDPDNFALLQRNLAPFGRRVRCLNSAVWSHSATLKISEETYRDGREWARTVRPAAPTEAGAMTAVDIGSLLASTGRDRISILKIDVEGAERQIFSENFAHWIDRVDNLVIELHGPECESAFQSAVADRGFRMSECDELTVCTRPSR